MDIKFLGGVAYDADRRLPVGTPIRHGLGSLIIHRPRRGKVTVEKLSRSGAVSYTTVIPTRKDALWVFKAGRAFRVVTPEQEKDPVRRVLRTAGVSVDVLRVVDAIDITVDMYGACRHMIDPSATVVLYDGTVEEIKPSGPVSYGHQGEGCLVGLPGKDRFTGGTYVIDSVAHSRRRNEIVEVLVTRDVDPVKLADALARAASNRP